jgi:hypothetical protein
MYQVVVGSFLANEQHEQKLKTQKNEVTSTVTPTAAAPVSTAGTIPNSHLHLPSTEMIIFLCDHASFMVVEEYQE